MCTTMLELYQRDGITAEPAGALAVAALRGAVEVPARGTVVCIVSGGNNDVSRYGEVVERSLVHEGLKHYFLVEFPQEPGALRGVLDSVLGATDEITLLEYVKKNNREIGPALVGIELADKAHVDGLLGRMERSGLHIERLGPARRRSASSSRSVGPRRGRGRSRRPTPPPGPGPGCRASTGCGRRAS